MWSLVLTVQLVGLTVQMTQTFDRQGYQPLGDKLRDQTNKPFLFVEINLRFKNVLNSINTSQTGKKYKISRLYNKLTPHIRTKTGLRTKLRVMQKCLYTYSHVPYLLIQYPRFQLSAIYRGQKKWRNKRFIRSKTRAKWELVVTW
jgi:hypothetical protein